MSSAVYVETSNPTKVLSSLSWSTSSRLLVSAIIASFKSNRIFNMVLLGSALIVPGASYLLSNQTKQSLVRSCKLLKFLTYCMFRQNQCVKCSSLFELKIMKAPLNNHSKMWMHHSLLSVFIHRCCGVA